MALNKNFLLRATLVRYSLTENFGEIGLHLLALALCTFRSDESELRRIARDERKQVKLRPLKGHFAESGF